MACQSANRGRARVCRREKECFPGIDQLPAAAIGRLTNTLVAMGAVDGQALQITTRGTGFAFAFGWDGPIQLSSEDLSMSQNNRIKRVSENGELSQSFTRRVASAAEHRAGKAGWILLWLLGVPIPVLLILFVLRGCT
jgi:hypothetical protein